MCYHNACTGVRLMQQAIVYTRVIAEHCDELYEYAIVVCTLSL